MTSSYQRKRKYQIAIVTLCIIIAGIVAFFTLYISPTCSDGKQNGEEEGIDCGGECPIVCGLEIVDPVVRWSRPILTRQGIYSVVAMVENLNVGVESNSASYLLRLYDKENLLVKEKTGKAFIPANTTFPIFEGGISVGSRDVTRVEFEFTEKPEWVRQTSYLDSVSVKNVEYIEKNNSPRVSASVENNTVRNLENIELVVLLYDIDENLINSSQTTLDKIRKNSSENIIFTWPALFDKEIVKIDIHPISKIQ